MNNINMNDDSGFFNGLFISSYLYEKEKNDLPYYCSVNLACEIVLENHDFDEIIKLYEQLD